MTGRRSVTTGASSAERGRVLENSVVAKPGPSTGRRKTPMQQQREYVGTDRHRRRSVTAGRSANGGPKATYKTDNSARALANATAEAGPGPEVVLEATYGEYWAADVLAAEGASAHLAHPPGNNWCHRRVKNDERDATDLAGLLRLGWLAEPWVAPPEVRELRELVGYRHRLDLVIG